MGDKRILVTGGGGYIGSHTIIELLNNNYEVIAVDNLINCYAEPNEKPESLKRVEKIVGKAVTFYKVDLTNKTELNSLFKKHKFDCAIHFAGLKAVGESMKIPLNYYENNIGGSDFLLEKQLTLENKINWDQHNN